MVGSKKVFSSLGLGVQSTALALLCIFEPDKLISLGLSLPQKFIFADTGAEHSDLYRHRDHLFDLLCGAGFEAVTVRRSTAIHETDRGLVSVPWRFRNERGKMSILSRQCTQDFKIDPIHAEIRRSLGYAKYKRIPVGSSSLWLGISSDERHRVRESRVKWIENVYPLILLDWTRSDCDLYNRYRLDYRVGKSACFFCPYTHRSDWVRRKNHDRAAFDRAVALEREAFPRLVASGKVPSDVYIHPVGAPLSEAVPDQLTLPLGSDFGYGSECEGLCDV